MTGLENLWKLYLPLVGWVVFGVILGYKLPQSIPLVLGKFLFWIGVPLSILTFLQQADLSASVWIAPMAAWAAMLLGAGLAWLWVQLHLRLPFFRSPSDRHHLTQRHYPLQHPPSQGSFLLAAMVGNTGYLGYPVALALVGPQYFGWAVFYDTLGSTLGAYGLGVLLAAHYGKTATNQAQFLLALIRNPALWSFWIGLGLNQLTLPIAVEQGMQGIGWTMIALSLLLLGMRLSQIRSWGSVQQASISLSIKMLLVPLVLGLSLSQFGIHRPAQLVIVLQMAMPPAFATLIIAEAYDLDRELTVTTLALGSLLLLLLLPFWLILFS
ncbi:AEC family transporter [Leptolyngbya sp. NK1-12]|uniref:AEC family transporter n=1 Tax=Leptolyngbya sp. NK1-12 TaxID=2547451 RepID=A0AA97APT8_9CYAN|nr:AEC family transporter [Leptolyngbya sp. NK1-12]WNZ22233.1 AEC family transporter [Leptolyngbya sp. NK1-12]